MCSMARQNFHKDCEEAINRQINMELYASYVYLSMVKFWQRNKFYNNNCVYAVYRLAIISYLIDFSWVLFWDGLEINELHYLNFWQAYYFDREDVALPGMHWYFKKASADEREHAMIFLKYLNKRGGRIILNDIRRPCKNVSFYSFAILHIFVYRTK